MNATRLALLLTVSLPACSTAPALEFELVEGTPMYDVLPRDAVRAIDRPAFVPLAEADPAMRPEETVIGVVGADGTAKAYSTWQLDAHEVVNDVLDGEPIAVTWSPLASAGIVYSRAVGDPRAGAATTLSFGVTGKLWNGVSVLYDRETGSLWTQVAGRALEGELAGAELVRRPSVFTTWGRWRELHRGTLVLAKDPESARLERSAYADYLEDPGRLFHPELARGLGGVRPKDLVWGVVADGRALAVTDALLAEARVVNAVVGRTGVALFRDGATGAVRAVETGAEGRVRVLEPLEGTDPGEALRDALTGERLATGELPAPHVDRAFWYAWARSRPGSSVLAR